MGRGLQLVFAYVVLVGSARAGDLPPVLQAKFISILANQANAGGKIHVKDPVLLAELGKLNFAHSEASKLAWAASEVEVKALKASGKLVICGKVEWLAAGGSVAVVEEGGKPQIYLHLGNIAASGVPLPDSIVKIGKKL